MAQCVWNALMDKNGIQRKQLALANQAMNGMVNIAKNHINVQTVESGMLFINNVSALKDLIGVDMHA